MEEDLHRHAPQTTLVVPVDSRSSLGHKATKRLVEVLTDECRFLSLTAQELCGVCFMAWRGLTWRGVASSSSSSSLEKRGQVRRARIAATSKHVQAQFSEARLHRKAAGLLVTVLWHRQQRKVALAFSEWRREVAGQHKMVSKLFFRWTLKVTATQLNRMKAIRMRDALLPLQAAMPRWLLQLGWRGWREGLAFRRTLLHVRLLFVCWRTAVGAMRAGRRRLVRVLFDSWRGHVAWVQNLVPRHRLRAGLQGLVGLQSRRRQLRKAVSWAERLPLRRALWHWLAASGSELLEARASAISGLLAPTRLPSPSPATSPRASLRPPRSLAGSPRASLSSVGPSDSFSTSPRRTPVPVRRVPAESFASPSPARAAWAKSMLNMTNLLASVPHSAAPGPPMSGYRSNRAASRSLLCESADRSAAQTAAAKAAPSTPHATSTATNKAAARAHLMASPAERFRLRLEGLKALAEVEIGPRGKENGHS